MVLLCVGGWWRWDCTESLGAALVLAGTPAANLTVPSRLHAYVYHTKIDPDCFTVTMKLSHILALPSALAVLTLAGPSALEAYDEHLTLTPLPQGYLYAGFNFTATASLSSYTAQHYRYFPRSLAQILQFSHTKELHLRFALGRWDEESWGRRPRDGKREGGTGVEIWAWLDGQGGEEAVWERWSTLVNSLSGLFCASLNFVDSTKTTRPILSFSPEGVHSNGVQDLQLLHGTLPHEVVCTENLTPFLKLLPCKGKAGISSLLDGHKVFDANWQTMSIDVRPLCPSSPDQECMLEIQQTVDLVLDIERSMRPRENPIPRPRPVEDVMCDESKSYHSADTCYPRRQEGEKGWSLSRIFGSAVKGSCHLGGADDSELNDITLTVPSERSVNISTTGTSTYGESILPESQARLYRLPESGSFDLQLPAQQLASQESVQQQDSPPLFASRQITGYGQERGGMHALLTNPHPYAQRIVYLESLPWFLRPYMHTLKVSSTSTNAEAAEVKMENMYYTPAIDRQRGTQLELLLSIPAKSTVEITYEFEKAILRYTEYPPDANRGFDVAPAVIRVLPSTSHEGEEAGDYYLRTTSLLLPLPTPDFSMPYNVIILTSTVIALGFGSLFNLLVRRFVLAEEVPVSPLALKVRQVVGWVRERISTMRRSRKDDEIRADGVVGADADGKVDGKLRPNGMGMVDGPGKER